MFLNQTSTSRSDIIDQCLWKYNCKYILHLPGFGSKNEESLNFGSFLHKVFELGYKEHDLKSLLKIAEENKRTYHIPFSLNEKTKIAVENFLLWNQKLGETISTERAFSVPLDAENDIAFIGVIDRVVKGKEGGYLVIDYKSSKREKKTKDLLSDKQMMGYAYAVHTEYGVDYKDIWCAHFYPLTGNFYPVRFSRFQIDNWRKKELDKVWRIRKKKKDEFPPMTNIFCDYCEFKPVCEKFNSKEQVCQRLVEQIELRDKLREERNKAIENKPEPSVDSQKENPEPDQDLN